MGKPLDEERRARLRRAAGVRSGEEPPATMADARLRILNEAGERTTAVMGEVLEAHGGSAFAFAAVCEGVMLNLAHQLWANAPGASPVELRRTLAKLAGSAADEVVRAEREAGA